MWLGLGRFFQLLVCEAQNGFCVVFSAEKFRYVLSESRIVADFGRELGFTFSSTNLCLSDCQCRRGYR